MVIRICKVIGCADSEILYVFVLIHFGVCSWRSKTGALMQHASVGDGGRHGFARNHAEHHSPAHLKRACNVHGPYLRARHHYIPFQVQPARVQSSTNGLVLLSAITQQASISIHCYR